MAGWRTFIEQQRAIGVGKVAGAGTGAERAFPEGDNSLRPARPCDAGAASRGRRRCDAAAPKPAAAIAAVRRDVRRSGDRRDTALLPTPPSDAVGNNVAFGRLTTTEDGYILATGTLVLLD